MSDSHFDIAITGMSGQFPGAADIATFGANLFAGKECLRRLRPEELVAAGVPEKEWRAENYVPVAGTLDDMDLFAASFFGVSPREAALMDPQQRRVLELAWHALEDAGISVDQFQGVAGVFVAGSLNTYLINNILPNPLIMQSEDLQQVLFGNGQDYLATRIAWMLDLRGPALTIQTACSSSLVAVHEACQHLLSHQVDLALAGGVSLSVPETRGYLYQPEGILSPDGHCRPFSAEAAGTVFSSGAGMVVLRRLEDAIAEGDAIYAVIRATAINNDGRQKASYTAPGIEGQAAVVALAQALANVTPDQIDFIETHGTATALGDAIELAALQKVFSTTDKKQFCALGAVKSSIGHLDVAAGVAGLIKTVLALQQEQIPATLHCENPGKNVDWKHSPFFVNTKPLPWRSTGHRHAGVSSFGIGGTNAHVIVAEAPSPKTAAVDSRPALLIFSAKTRLELQKMLGQFAEYCHKHPAVSLSGLAGTLQLGRAAFAYRAALIVSSVSELGQCLATGQYTDVLCENIRETIHPKDIGQCTPEDLQHLMTQWLAGHVINWHTHYPSHPPQKLHLPLYPFSRSRYWLEPYVNSEKNAAKKPIDEWFYLPGFKKCLSLTAHTMTAKAARPVLVFLPPDPSLQQLLQQHAIFPCLRVFPQPCFEKRDDTTWGMDFANTAHYLELLTQLKSGDGLPDRVLHAGSLTPHWQASSPQCFTEAQAFGLNSILFFIQAFEKGAAGRSLGITVLTNRLNQVATEGVSEPHKAPLLAAVKVIPKEFVTVQTQLIDADFIDQPQALAFQLEQLSRDIFAERYAVEEIVYRGRQRWHRDYIPVTLTEPRLPWPQHKEKNKVILITGGLGQLGLDIADYFAKRTPCTIALLTRTVFPDETQWPHLLSTMEEAEGVVLRINRIIALQQQGASVGVFTADVGDADSLLQAVSRIESRFGAIDGLVHAAGETVNGIISMKSMDALRESYQAKVWGTYHLCHLFQHRKLDFMILCSSMNAIIGGLGQLDNTAANAFIDYMADCMSALTGQNILAINWGAVNVDRPMPVNVLPQFSELSREHKKNRMTDDEVNQVYERLLTHKPGSRIVISTLDMNHVLQSWNHVASLEELGKERLNDSPSTERSIAPDQQPATAIQQWVAQCWRQLLGVNGIGLDDSFFALGGHSLSAIQFMTKIHETFGIRTHVMNLYEMQTLGEFSHFIEKMRTQKKPSTINTFDSIEMTGE